MTADLSDEDEIRRYFIDEISTSITEEKLIDPTLAPTQKIPRSLYDEVPIA